MHHTADILGSSNFGQAPQPPQLSPNRNVQLSSSGNGNIGGGSGGGPQRSIFGPRVFPGDRRPMPGGLGGGPMVCFYCCALVLQFLF